MSRKPYPPGPGRLTAYRNVRPFLRNRADFLLNLHRNYGDYARFPLGLFDVYLINDPEMIRHVLMNPDEFVKTPAVKYLKYLFGDGLLLSDGEFHRRQRRLMLPAFRPARIAGYGAIMTQIAEETAARWHDMRDIEMHQEMMRLALRIATKTLFGAERGDVTDRVAAAVDTLTPFIDRVAQPTGAAQLLLPSPANFRFRRARKELREIISGLIDENRARGEDTGDLLSTLIAAVDDEGDGSGMTDQELRDEAMTLFLAGHETTAVALSWTWYLLARHPEVESKLREELAAVLNGRTPTVDDVPELKYTRMVLSESLRLYPPAYLIDRVPVQDWDDGKFVVPKGKYIFLSPYVMHRHPEHWPDPDRFDPERWTPEEVGRRPRFAYFPFGGGPRTCIGESFAWMEMVLVVATLAQRFTISLRSPQPIDIAPLITLRPKGGVPMRLGAPSRSRKVEPVG